MEKSSEVEFHKYLKYKMFEMESNLEMKWSKTHSINEETFGERNTVIYTMSQS